MTNSRIAVVAVGLSSLAIIGATSDGRSADTVSAQTTSAAALKAPAKTTRNAAQTAAAYQRELERIARARQVAAAKRAVKRGDRRKPGTVYRASAHTLCRVYLLSRTCWKSPSAAHKRWHQARLRRLAIKRARARAAAIGRQLGPCGRRRGIVAIPGFPGERADRCVLPQIAALVAMYGVRVSDCYGQGHRSPGHTQEGTACDMTGPIPSTDAAVAALTRAGRTVIYDGRFGSKALANHGPGHHLHVEFNRSW